MNEHFERIIFSNSNTNHHPYHQLLDYGKQDLWLMGGDRIALLPSTQSFGIKTLNCLTSLNDFNCIEYYLINNNSYTKKDIKCAIKCTNNSRIIDLLAFHYNKDRMKKIIELNRKKLIWKYTFNWLTKPTTNDGLLGIDLRLGLKHLQELKLTQN
jgi:hypothetical protein